MAVRNESVRISAVDDFSTPVAKMAAAAALFDKTLDRLDGTSLNASRGLAATAKSVNQNNDAFRRGTADINQYSGRLRLIADAAITLGPALIPIGAVAVPAVTGLASAFGFAAAGATASIVAFQGVGDALSALNKAHLEPTEANLAAARQALEQISPAAQEFVTELDAMMPALRGVRDAAAEGLFPGMVEALDSIEGALPRVSSLFGTLGEAMGDLAADAAEGLTGPKWEEFFRFIEAEAPAALETMGSALGSLAHAFAELWMAFGPVNQDFIGWLDDSAAAFDRWASGLSETEGFQNFVDYLRDSGPQVAAAAKAIGNALVQIVQAAAPLGGPTLQIITRFAEALAKITDSPLGTPLLALAAGLAAVSRAAKGLDAVNIGGFGTGITSMVAKTGAVVGFAAALEGLANTAALLDGFADSADVASRSVGDIASALQDSAVGEHASDLGIDIQRLSEDLAANGAQGEYVKQVMADLGDQTGLLAQGFDALNPANEALSLIGFNFGKNANEAKQTSLALGGVLEQLDLIGDHQVGSGLDDLLGGFREGADAARSFKQELLDLNNVLAGRASFRDYQAAIDAATEALKRNGKTLDTTTEKGRENEAALDSIATTALRVAEGMDKADRKDFLRSTRENLKQAAIDFGMTEKRADALARRLLGLPPAQIKGDDSDFRNKAGATEKRIKALNFLKANPAIDANDEAFAAAFGLTKRDLAWLNRQIARARLVADPAGVISGVNKAQAALNAIDGRSVTTYIATVHRPAGGADGMTVQGPRAPYGDKVYAHLAPGEEVISNRFGQADRHRALLKAINANAYANGGTIGTHARSFANGGTADSFFDVATDIRHGLDSVFVPWRAIMRQELKAAEQRRDALKEDLDALKDHRNALRDAARSLSDTIAGKFGVELGEDASLGSLTTDLTRQGNLAGVFGTAAQTLKLMGLDGPALQWLLENSTAQQLQGFVNEGQGAIDAFEAQFNQTHQAGQGAGQAASFAVFGKELRESNVELRESRQELKKLNSKVERLEKLLEDAPEDTGKAVGKVINGAAQAGRNRQAPR